MKNCALPIETKNHRIILKLGKTPKDHWVQTLTQHCQAQLPAHTQHTVSTTKPHPQVSHPHPWGAESAFLCPWLLDLSPANNTCVFEPQDRYRNATETERWLCLFHSCREAVCPRLWLLASFVAATGMGQGSEGCRNLEMLPAASFRRDSEGQSYK